MEGRFTVNVRGNNNMSNTASALSRITAAFLVGIALAAGGLPLAAQDSNDEVRLRPINRDLVRESGELRKLGLSAEEPSLKNDAWVLADIANDMHNDVSELQSELYFLRLVTKPDNRKEAAEYVRQSIDETVKVLAFNAQTASDLSVHTSSSAISVASLALKGQLSVLRELLLQIRSKL